MSKKNLSYNFDFIEVVRFFIRYWKALSVLCFATAVLAFVFTMPIFMKPQYQSKATFYPGTANSTSVALFYTIKDKVKDPLQFADLEVTEQFLQIMKSDQFRSTILSKYKLAEHYGLDMSNQSAGQKLGILYEKNITIKRTDFNSIDVIVQDHDPEKAAEVANGIVYTVNAYKKEIQGRVSKQIFQIIEQTYQQKLNYIDSIKTRLKELGAEGVYDLSNQAKGISEVVGKGQNNQFTEREKLKLGSYGGEVMLLTQMLEFEAENLTFLKTKYDQAKLDLTADLDHVFIVSYAGPSYDKVSPKRKVITIFSVLSAFVLGCIALIGIEQFKRIKEHIN